MSRRKGNTKDMVGRNEEEKDRGHQKRKKERQKSGQKAREDVRKTRRKLR
jgi:hypothetical protein